MSIDLKKKACEQAQPLRNRWHPDIPPVAEVTVGELFRLEMVDFSGGRTPRIIPPMTSNMLINL